MRKDEQLKSAVLNFVSAQPSNHSYGSGIETSVGKCRGEFALERLRSAVAQLHDTTNGYFARCSFQSTGNRLIRPSNCNPAGCRPFRIASTISGASSVSRSTRPT